jgi:hypothetical protein
VPIEAEFPLFDPHNMPSPWDLLSFFINPEGRRLLPFEKPFELATATEQLDYLRAKREEGLGKIGRARGDVAKHLRGLREKMYVSALFQLSAASYNFMNKELRDFLNLNDDGTDDYNFDVLKDDTTNWKEETSFGSQMHQTYAEPDDPTKLNAKFVNKDGREAVFDPSGDMIRDYPDKGTYNYANAPDPLHAPCDMAPYMRLMDLEYPHIQRINRFAGSPYSHWPNSELWGMDKERILRAINERR